MKDTSDPELLRKFMKRFPNSPRFWEAQHRLDVLVRIARDRDDDEKRQKAERERQKAEAELAKAWAVVQGTDDQNRLRDFIRRYPDSQYASEAKQRLEAIVREAREREEQARALAAETKRQQAEAEMARAFDTVRDTTDQDMVR